MVGSGGHVRRVVVRAPRHGTVLHPTKVKAKDPTLLVPAGITINLESVFTLPAFTSKPWGEHKITG